MNFGQSFTATGPSAAGITVNVRQSGPIGEFLVNNPVLTSATGNAAGGVVWFTFERSPGGPAPYDPNLDDSASDFEPGVSCSTCRVVQTCMIVIASFDLEKTIVQHLLSLAFLSRDLCEPSGVSPLVLV